MVTHECVGVVTEQPLRLLLIELDGSRSRLHERLERHPAVNVVGGTTNTDEALRLAVATDPTVVLLDVRIWDVDAPSFCGELRRVISSPIAVMASFMEPARWDEFKAAGATELMLRGKSTADLVAALERLSA